MYMDIPELSFGDEDEAYSEVVAERRLFLAVFIRAVSDLFSADRNHKEHAIEWFKGAPARVTFEEVNNMFDFKDSRIQKLKAYVDGVDKEKRHFRHRLVTNFKGS